VWYFLRPLLSYTFGGLWILPLFCLSRVINVFWFQDVANSAFRGRFRSMDFPTLVADTVYSLVIQALFLLQVNSYSFDDRVETFDRKLSDEFVVSSPDDDIILSCQLYFLLQATLVVMLPIAYLGSLISLVFMSILYALYSFEYKWFNTGWDTPKRLHFIENNWPYFLGFGLPLALLTIMTSSYYINGVIFSVLFPFFIVSANEAKVARGLW
jgi:etoposide-induced 2.4 mRNA